ncbi:hypothetical protein VTJ04DRAFT_1100 [Mycothermus thermophilus]|uniref:uncharacterized protein n=1 Tax=Humicola insolens TaxID=85995 RepID=UPI003743C38C
MNSQVNPLFPPFKREKKNQPFTTPNPSFIPACHRPFCLCSILLYAIKYQKPSQPRQRENKTNKSRLTLVFFHFPPTPPPQPQPPIPFLLLLIIMSLPSSDIVLVPFLP